MTDTLNPRDAKDIEAAVQWALAESKTLDVLGHGSLTHAGWPGGVVVDSAAADRFANAASRRSKWRARQNRTPSSWSGPF